MAVYTDVTADDLNEFLAGYDLGWIETRGPWQASYARLPPGSYVFRVSAAQADGAWGNDAVHLAVLVTPAWWQTGWFRAAAVLGIAALAALGARAWSHRRLKQRLAAVEHEHALEKERAHIARDLHDELGGSLTQIGMLAERIKRHPDAADLKTSLSGLAWRTRRLSGELESIVWTVNPKNDTWDRLALFIEQYARNFCRDSAIRRRISASKSSSDCAYRASSAGVIFRDSAISTCALLRSSASTSRCASARSAGPTVCCCAASAATAFPPNATAAGYCLARSSAVRSCCVRLTDVIPCGSLADQ